MIKSDFSHRYKITSLPSVPPIIHQLSTSPRLATTDMSSVVAISSGAAYLPPSLAQKVSKQIGGGVRVVHGYGLSEVVSRSDQSPSRC